MQDYLKKKKFGLFIMIIIVLSSSSVFAFLKFYGTKQAEAAPTEDISVIRENCGETPKCYESLKDWEDDYGGIDFAGCVQGDLTCLTVDKIAVAQIEGDWSTRIDSTPFEINGWVTDEDNKIIIHTTGEARHKGVYGGNPSAYRLEFTSNNANVYLITIKESYVEIDGLQIYINGDGYSNNGAIRVEGVSDVKLKNNIIKGEDNTSIDNSFYGIRVKDAGAEGFIWNNIIYGFLRSQNDRGVGIKLTDDSTGYIYNNSVSNCGIGIEVEGFNLGDVKVVNNAVFNNNDDFDFSGATITQFDSNASDDDISSEDSGWVNISPGAVEADDWNEVFVDYAGSDFHLKQTVTGANLIDAGADLLSENLFSDDIDGEARPTGNGWDIGADEMGVEPNVHSFGWSGNYGWISFDYKDCDTNASGEYIGSPAGCPTSGLAIPFGVNIDNTTGFLSGYAWSSNVGWISFQEKDNLPPSSDFNENCEDWNGASSACTSANNCTACINRDDSGANVYGWGKVLAYSDPSNPEEGWLRFDDVAVGFDYEDVTIDRAVNPVGTNRHRLHGWAWDGDNIYNKGIGWVSFNCEDYNACIAGDLDKIGVVCIADGDCGTGGNCQPACGLSEYYVWTDLNWPPEVDSLSAPNLSHDNACSGSVLSESLQWDFEDEGDTGLAYRIVLKDGAGAITILDTGKCIDFNVCQSGDPECSSEECKIDPDDCMGEGSSDHCTYTLDDSELDYNTAYQWFVQVWDSYNVPSGLVQFNENNGDIDTNILILDINDINPLTFTTPVSEFPRVADFNIFIPDPSVEEEILFDGSDSYYFTGNFGTRAQCVQDALTPGNSTCEWLWSDPGGEDNVEYKNPDGTEPPILPAETGASVVIKFKKEKMDTQQTIKLKITDNNNYWCERDKSFNIKYQLPTWIEVR